MGERGAAAEEDRAAVLAAHEELYAAVEAGDLDRFERVCAPGELVCVHPGAAPVHGRGPVLRSWAVVMAGTDYVQFILTDVAVTVAGDVAAVTCTENVLTGRQGSTEVFGAGRAQAVNVFRRYADGWRLWLHQAGPPGPAGGR